MKEAFGAQQKQSTAPVVAAADTTLVSFAELPAKPSVPAGTSDSSLTNSLQGSSTTSHHASVSAPSTTPAGYGLLAVVKQLHIRAPGTKTALGEPHPASTANSNLPPLPGLPHLLPQHHATPPASRTCCDAPSSLPSGVPLGREPTNSPSLNKRTHSP